jgi:hypothetical protein
MRNELDPIIDQWYAHLDKGQRFFVVDVDDDEKMVEIQHFDGDLEELSFAEWHNLKIELSEEPENWSGALDIAETDDFGTEVTDTTKQDWNEPGKDYRS